MTLSKNKKSSQFAKYIGPVIQAIRELGGSGRPDEVRALIARNLGISDVEQTQKKETQHHSTRVTMTAKEQGVVKIDGNTSASSFHAAAAPENQ